jgi:hypothetical protein
MKLGIIFILLNIFLFESAFAAKKIYKYRKSQEHKFGGADVLGDGFDPSGSILNEEHPQTFNYIFDKKTKVIKKINQISKYAGRSL